MSMDELNKTERAVSSCICTVLLITYNHRPYFRRAIESVLEQKTRYKFKLHIFDDASTDGTSELVREYAKKYPKQVVPFISERNRGAQENIWNAYKSVDTKYCAVLECDDYWCDEKKLQLQIHAMETHPKCSFCAHNTVLYTLDENTREYSDGSLWITRRLFKAKNIIHYVDIEPIDIGGYIPHISSRLIRSRLLNLDKIKYKESILFDFNQYFYLLLKGPYYYIDRTMSAYQKTGTGIHSGKPPLVVLTDEFERIGEFNRQTNFIIADKIFREYRLQLDHRLNLFYDYKYKTGYVNEMEDSIKESLFETTADEEEHELFFSSNPAVLQSEVVELKTQLKNIKQSKTYRLSRFILFIPQKTLIFCRSCRDNGFIYTLKKVRSKLKKQLKKMNRYKPIYDSAVTSDREDNTVNISILKNKLDRDVFYFLCSAGIGDTLLVCGLRYALEEKLNGRLHLLIPPSHEILMEMYGVSDYTLVTWEGCDLEKVSDLASSPAKGKIFVAHPHVHRELKRFFYPIKEQISTRKFFPWFLEFLELPENTKLQELTVIPALSEDLRKKIEEIAPLDKIALICVEAKSMLWLPEEFWENKVKELKKSGLTVISNAVSSENVIAGTRWFHMSLSDAIALAYACHSVYALRSGFCDAIYFKGKDLHVYYPRHSSLFIYSLNDLFGRNDIDEQIILV